jgi:hypothetical protein
MNLSLVSYILNGQPVTPILSNIGESERLFPMLYNFEYVLCSFEYKMITAREEELYEAQPIQELPKVIPSDYFTEIDSC